MEKLTIFYDHSVYLEQFGIGHLWPFGNVLPFDIFYGHLVILGSFAI
jgi:hypothetical protein